MNQDTFKGNWKQIKGRLKQQWGRLTDDDLTRVEGDRDVLIGKLQERYGLARDQAEKQLDSFLSADKGQQRKAG